MTINTSGIVNIIIKATDKTGGVLGSAFGKIQSLSKKAAMAGVVAAGAASVAMAGIAVDGIRQFATFEDSINEVFTLLPGISGEAMDAMKTQVLDAAGEMGRLPNEVIPALYQSLSAGVPQDNVFEFLEQAHKAALGGVTDLETAVDGISSVVNAYGSDVLGAGKASDLMFTAVRLGKTNFEELSASLSNVTPMASAMGVGFEDVTAAIATMTAQGTPTAQATTQMRAVLQELGTTGTEVSDIFTDIAGKSFLEFIDSGGNVSEALQLLEQHAVDTGTPIQDFFGNVRAGVGVLQLTGSGAETFSKNLAEMAGSAGATDAAFETMNTGLNRVLEVLKAKASGIFIKFGDSIAPIARVIGEKLITKLADLEPVLNGVIDTIGRFVDGIMSGRPVLDVIGETILHIASFILPMTEDEFDNLGDSVSGIIGSIRSFIEAGQNLISRVTEWLAPIIVSIAQFVSLQDILTALGVVVAAVLIPIILSLITTIAPIVLIIGGIIAVVSLLRNAWENDWGGIQEKLTAVIGFISPIFNSIVNWLSVNVPLALGALYTYWVDVAWPGIQNVIETVWPVIRNIFTSLIGWVTDKLIPTVKDLYQKWTEVWWPTIQSVLENVWTIIEAVFEEIGRWINDNIIPWVEYLGEVWSDTVWPAIQKALENVWKVIEPIFEKIRDWMEDKIPSAITAIRGGFESGMSAIESAVKPVQELWDRFISAVKEFWDWITGHQFKFKISIPDLPSWAIPHSPLPIHTAWKEFAQDMNKINLKGFATGFKPFSRVGTTNNINSIAGGTSSTSIVNYNITANYPFQKKTDLAQDIKALQLMRG